MNKKAYELGSKRSVIRDLFEYGRERSALYGEDSVFDFTLGNPSIPSPKCIDEAICNLVNNSPSIHGYTSAQGDPKVREEISRFIKKEYDFSLPSNLIYMTSGAASALTIVFNALHDENSCEFIVNAPYFPEYKVFVESAGCTLKVIPSLDDNFGLNIDGIRNAINEKTAGIIINSPNNPSGNVYSEDEIIALCDMLREEGDRLSKELFLIADEPYREVVYDVVTVPYIPRYYDNTIVCYSWSKVVSLAGERIGYIALSPLIKDANELYFAICGAGRALGYVCASSLFQRVVVSCLGKTSDMSLYDENRNLLYNALKGFGFNCLYPKGAFYLFVKSPIDNHSFLELAKELGILFVPSESFGVDGWVRIAYCVSRDRIEKSLPLFERLAKKCGL